MSRILYHHHDGDDDDDDDRGGGDSGARLRKRQREKHPPAKQKQSICFFLVVALIFSLVSMYISISPPHKQHQLRLTDGTIDRPFLSALNNENHQNLTNIRNETTKDKSTFGQPSFSTLPLDSSAQQRDKRDQSALLSLPLSPKPHPHAGARYRNGTWGLVADVTLARRWFIRRYNLDFRSNDENQMIDDEQSLQLPPMNYLTFQTQKQMSKVCDTPPGKGLEKKAGWKLLTQKVQVSANSSMATSKNDPNLFIEEPKGKQPKILCAIYTYDQRHYMIPSLIETWGWKCDGFLAASTETVLMNDKTTRDGAYIIDLPHEGNETYDNMWQKSRSIWAYIYDNYLQEYDFFYLSGDDTHVIVENLRSFLQSMVDNLMNYPLYLGHWIPDLYDRNNNKTENPYYFIGGGPGYVLNRKAVQILVEDVLPNCGTTTVNSAEDRILGYCFRTIAGVLGNNTVDLEGSQRFHGMDPSFVATSKGDTGFFQHVYEYWGKRFVGGFQTGMNLTSANSISFHLLKYPVWLRRHHAILYKSCPAGTALGDAFH